VLHLCHEAVTKNQKENEILEKKAWTIKRKQMAPNEITNYLITALQSGNLK
jgi:hypothetical protein